MARLKTFEAMETEVADYIQRTLKTTVVPMGLSNVNAETPRKNEDAEPAQPQINEWNENEEEPIDNLQKGKSGQKGKGKGNCWNCGKSGHRAAECWSRPTWKGKGKETGGYKGEAPWYKGSPPWFKGKGGKEYGKSKGTLGNIENEQWYAPNYWEEDNIHIGGLALCSVDKVKALPMSIPNTLSRNEGEVHQKKFKSYADAAKNKISCASFNDYNKFDILATPCEDEDKSEDEDGVQEQWGSINERIKQNMNKPKTKKTFGQKRAAGQEALHKLTEEDDRDENEENEKDEKSKSAPRMR